MRATAGESACSGSRQQGGEDDEQRSQTVTVGQRLG